MRDERIRMKRFPEVQGKHIPGQMQKGTANDRSPRHTPSPASPVTNEIDGHPTHATAVPGLTHLRHPPCDLWEIRYSRCCPSWNGEYRSPSCVLAHHQPSIDFQSPLRTLTHTLPEPPVGERTASRSLKGQGVLPRWGVQSLDATPLR